ncbi:MAG: lysophospholipid acyltransferase family protein [Myxococcota bacterium]
MSTSPPPSSGPPLTPSLRGRPAAALPFLLGSWLRLLIGGAGMAVCSVVCIAALFCALPSRKLRVCISNVYGSVAGRFMFFCSGSRLVLRGYEEALQRGPAIWAMNHASLIDIPLGIWLSPVGTVGVGKREVIYYPFFGVLYVLAGHLRIERGNTARAVASMRAMAEWVRRHHVSIFLWPEGTRSRDGRLLPFKKGIVHLALQTGLPIQPMVAAGTHRVWPKGPPRISPGIVEIDFPPLLQTGHWSAERSDEALAELEAVFEQILPVDQRRAMPHPGLAAA